MYKFVIYKQSDLQKLNVNLIASISSITFISTIIYIIYYMK